MCFTVMLRAQPNYIERTRIVWMVRLWFLAAVMDKAERPRRNFPTPDGFFQLFMRVPFVFVIG